MFDIDIAKTYGVNAAVILSHLYFWIQKNEANNHNYYDGCYWTYNSRSAFTKIFPYLSERQIKTALDKLIEGGVIKTGCYNQDARDRSLWYAFTEKGKCIMQKCQMQTAEMSNANSGNVRPLPDIRTTYTDTYTDTDRVKRERFVPPTVEEVSAYASENGYRIDAQRFVDFYISKGWLVGKTPMKDWQAAVRGWVRRDNTQHTATQSVQKSNPALDYEQRDYKENDYSDYFLDLDNIDDYKV